MPRLTELGRRVLGHLPVWAEDEAKLVEAEGGAGHSVRSYTVEEMVQRLIEDPSVEELNADAVQVLLEALHANGWASQKNGEWRMLKAGLAALTAATDDAEPEGAVSVELHPAVHDSNAVAS